MGNHNDPSPILRFINYMAAFFGVGSFLGMVNLGVGVLSAAWLAAQLYGYFKYEVPYKKMRNETERRKKESGESQ